MVQVLNNNVYLFLRDMYYEGDERKQTYFWHTEAFLNLCPYQSVNRPNRLRFAYTHCKSHHQSLDKISFKISNIFQAMRSCAMSAKSSIILRHPKSMVT